MKTSGQVFKFSGKFKVRLLQNVGERQVFAKCQVLEDYNEQYKKGSIDELSLSCIE